MNKRKIVVIVAMLILSVPIIGFAQANGLGVPFRDLQIQINNLQQEISSLHNKIQYIQQTKMSEGAQGPVGPAGPIGPRGPAGVANGITIAVHGEVDEDGKIVGPSDKFLCYKLSEFDDAMIYHIRLLSMSDPTKNPPTCIVAPGPHSINSKWDLSMYQDDSQFDYDVGAWEFSVISQRPNGFVFSKYKSAFNFICVQE